MKKLKKKKLVALIDAQEDVIQCLRNEFATYKKQVRIFNKYFKAIGNILN